MAWEAFYGGPVRALMVPDSEIVGVESVALSEDRTKAQVTIELADKRPVRFRFASREKITAAVIDTEDFYRRGKEPEDWQVLAA